jgi:hypothetical protein
MFFVARGVDERDGPVAALLTEFFDHVQLLPEFSPIAPLKLIPPCRLVVEPPAQFGTGGNVFHPEIDGGTLLAEPARPEPFHQNSRAIVGRWMLIRPLQANLRHQCYSPVSPSNLRLKCRTPIPRFD